MCVIGHTTLPPSCEHNAGFVQNVTCFDVQQTAKMFMNNSSANKTASCRRAINTRAKHRDICTACQGSYIHSLICFKRMTLSQLSTHFIVYLNISENLQNRKKIYFYYVFFLRRPIQCYVFFPGGLSSLTRHFQQVL